MDIDIRNVSPADLPAIPGLNDAEIPHVNAMTATMLEHFTRQASYFRVASRDRKIVGFLIALGPVADYQSPNFRLYRPQHVFAKLGMRDALFAGMDGVHERLAEGYSQVEGRDLLGGPRRYKDLQKSLNGIGTNLLATRLKELEQAGLIEIVAQPPPSSVQSYQLTSRGRTLEPTVTGLAHWGLSLLDAPRDHDHWQPQWNHVALKARFNPQEAKGLHATYAFEIGGYPHYAVVKDGALATYEGTAPDPDLVVRASNENFLRVVEGELNLKEAIQRGVISVEGTGEVLLQMARVFTA